MSVAIAKGKTEVREQWKNKEGLIVLLVFIVGLS